MATLPPTVMHEQHECPQHGPVSPVRAPALPNSAALASLAAGSQVPFWLPWPLPAAWLFAGVRVVGGGRQPVQAVAMAFSGRGLAAGPADVIIVAETPGTGFGARWAGVAEPEPDLVSGPATTKARVAGRPTPLWHLPTAGRGAFVGEAAGCWLWFVSWPDSAWPAFDDDLVLVDLREHDVADLPTGALLPRLTEG